MPKQLVLQGKQTKEDFLLLYKKCRDLRLKERYHALYLSFMYEWEEIATILGRDYQTILEWAGLYNENGVEGLDPDRPPGRPSSLTKDQISEVRKIVMQCPRDIGLRFSNWTVGSICKWIAGKFGVALSGERIRQLLHAIGFSYVKPAFSYILADRKEREEFLSELTEISSNGTPFLFEDEATVGQHPTLHGMWVLKGTKAKIRTFGNHAKRHAFAVVNPVTGEKVSMVAKRLTADTFVRFIDKLAGTISGDFTLILDNSPCHKANISLERLERYRDRINVVWLPRYSPDLNPVEHMWKEMKFNVSHNHMFDTVNRLGWGMIGYFRQLKPETVRSVCSTDYLFGKL